MHAAQIQFDKFDIQAIQTSWQAFDELAHLHPIHNEAEYDRMLALMNFLLDAALSGGGTTSLRMDPLGKSMAQMLLDLEVRVPADWVARL